MSRIHARHPAAFALALGLAATGVAFADDSSMSRLTGDSYAYFNDLDYHPGGFNTPRAPQGATGLAKASAKDKAKGEDKDKMAQRQTDDRPAKATRRLFHDDGGA